MLRLVDRDLIVESERIALMVDNGKEMLDLWKTKLEWLNCREAFFDHIEILWKL